MKLSFNPLDLVMFVAALLAISVGLFRELREPRNHVRLIVPTVFIVYALVQFPSAVIAITDPQGVSAAREIIRALFAIGKIALFFAMLTIVVSFYRASLTQRFVSSVRIGSLIMATAVTLLLTYYKIYEVVRAAMHGAASQFPVYRRSATAAVADAIPDLIGDVP